MKELYISPELKVLCFAPVEHLADFSLDDLYPDESPDGGLVPDEISKEGDFGFDFFG